MSCIVRGVLRALRVSLARRRGDHLALTSWALVLLLVSVASASSSPPNIVMILADDMSWVGTSVQMDPDIPESRSDYHQTPVLEQLAREGMVFSRAYAAAPVCGPSRAALETGKSPAALRVTDLRHAGQFFVDFFEANYTGRPLMPPLPRPIIVNPYETTLGQMLKQVNPEYRTAVFGKFDWLPAATGVGYDEAIAFLPNSPNPATDPRSMFSIAAAGMDFMERKVAENKPFFVNFAHWAIKPPLQARPATKAEFEQLPRGVKHFDVTNAAMHKDLDTTIGMVLDKIAELGIEDNTYVFVTSDHGASTDVISSLNNQPLYGGKGTLFEGGVRVPLIIKGPGVAPSTYSNEAVSLMDLFPTLYELGGGATPLSAEIEGTSIVGLLENGGQLPSGQGSLHRTFGPNGEVFVHYPHYTHSTPFVGESGPHSAIIDGDFKLVRRYGENGAPDTLLLFNLRDNIQENNDPSSPLNLATSMPEKVAELNGKLEKWLRGVDASLPYDVRTPVQISWSADQRGSFHGIADVWRSTTDLDSFDREVWIPSNATPGPAGTAPATLVDSNPHQPRLPRKAFQFDGLQGFTRRFFHVSDATKPDEIDADHSATFEFWVRLDDLTRNQLLFESGSVEQGLSLTFGDGDGDAIRDDLRFRILGKSGNQLTVTADVNRFADITKDFLHIAAVLNDSDAERCVEIYVNGALAARSEGEAGPNELDWDGFYMASLGMLNRNTLQWTGNLTDTLGAASGAGELPFTGGNLRGRIASFQFTNYRLTPQQVLASYNSMLEPADHGIHSVFGDAAVLEQRPANLSLDAIQSSSLAVLNERSDRLTSTLPVDALVSGPGMFTEGNAGTSGLLAAGTKFTSYLLQFDPASNNSGAIETVAGAVEFQQEILALVFAPPSLSATDKVLGAVGEYGSQLDRGLTLAGGDFLSISEDRRTLSFNLGIPGDEMLQFRVITNQVLATDFDDDGLVDVADLSVLEAAYGETDAGDADFDGDTDGLDFLAWQRQSASFAADFDRNGEIDSLDLARWESSYGVDAGADVDRDGDTDGTDFLAWQRAAASNTLQAAATPVPEPPTVLLLIVVSIVFGVGHWRCAGWKPR